MNKKEALDQVHATLYAEAHAAGQAAYDACVPHAVVFGQAASLFGDTMVPGTARLEPEGLCGFAWVEVRPTVSPFAKWQYGRCVTVRAGGPSQSVERKEAYAYAFAKVLTAAGIRAVSASRLD